MIKEGTAYTSNIAFYPKVLNSHKYTSTSLESPVPGLTTVLAPSPTLLWPPSSLVFLDFPSLQYPGLKVLDSSSLAPSCLESC